MIHDDEFLDSVAVLALGALPEAEARTLAEHVATCESCRAEYMRLREAADFVGYAAESPTDERDEPAAGLLKARIMHEVRGDAPVSAAQGRAGFVTSTRPRTAWLAYGAAAAAAIVAMLVFADDASQRHANVRSSARIADLERHAAAQSAQTNDATSRARALHTRIAQIVAPGSKHFAVASGEVVTSGGRVIVALGKLPSLPKGKVYQAWTLARGSKTVVPSITFSPDASGIAIVELPERAAHLAAVAVSVEPDGGSKKPTSKPKFVRPLS